MTFSLEDCPSVQPFRQAQQPHADFLWKSPSSQGDLNNSRAHGRLQSQTSRYQEGLAQAMEVIITQWLSLSRSLQLSHQDGSLSSVSNFPWLPFWELGTQLNLVSTLWLIPRRSCHKSEPPHPTPQCLIPPAGRQFRISCRHGCPN